MSSPRLPRTPVSPPPAHGCRAPARRGFAIIISITLLAFLVLLLLSLVLLTRVGTQISANGLQDAQARQNALMAVQVAMGQLQKFAGPDQRITAPAEFGDFSSTANGGIPISPFTPVASTGVVSPQTGTRYWTGVWGNSDPGGAIFLRSPKPRLLTWLVSGNEAVTVPSTTKYGQIISGAPAVTYTPSMSVSGLTASSSALTALSIGSVPAVLLVGGNSATSSTTLPKAEDNFVAAPLVNISISAQMLPGFSGTQTKLSGRYAFVVLDEGVKAKVNLRDPYDGSNTLSGTTATNIDARVRVQAAQRTGIELVTGFADSATPVLGKIGYPVNLPSVSASTAVDTILALPQARFLDSTAITSSADTAIRENFHSLTPYSFGVVADSQRGGLRKDLTALFEDPILFTSKAVLPLANSTTSAKNILPDSAEPTANVAEPSMKDPSLPSITSQSFSPGSVSPQSLANTGILNGPTWSQLRSFYANAASLSSPTSTMTISAGTSTQSAVTPVIAQSRVYFSVDLQPVGGTNHLFIQTYVFIALGNPYTVTLSAPSGVNFYFQDAAEASGASGTGGMIGITGVSNLPSPANSTRNAGGGYPILWVGTWSPNGIIFGPSNTQALMQAFLPYEQQLVQKNPGLDRDPSVLGSTLFNTGAFKLAPGQITGFVVSGAGTQVGTRTQSGTTVQTVAMTPATAAGVVSNFFNHDTGVATTNSTMTGLGTNDWGTWSVYMTDPAHNNATMQALIANDEPGNGRASGITAMVGQLTPIQGTLNMLVLPGVVLYGAGGDTGGEQNGGHQRLFADYNLRGTFHPAPATSTIFQGLNFCPPWAGYTPGSSDGAGAFTQYSADTTPPAWGWDFSSSQGTSLELFDLPRRANPSEEPILSIGYLQHANLGGDDWFPLIGHQPGNAVGNSLFSPFVSRLASAETLDDWQYGSPGVPYNFYDMSYLLNCALWDHYFFSSIPQSPLIAGSVNPANPRLKFAAGFTPTAAQLGLGTTGASGTDSTGQALPKEYAAARYLMIDGAFNINSTSIEAWKAVLAGLRKRSATINDPAGATTASSSFPRSIYQTGTYTAANTGTGSPAYAGFQKLSDVQIATLAANIVQEIRLRGPFLSLAHFINRTGLTGLSGSPTPLAATAAATVQVEGALQEAIDRSRINLPANSALLPGTTFDLPTPETNSNPGNTSPFADILPTITTSTTQPGACVTLNCGTGIPGWLTQADVLEALGPALAARSDTFVIRAYGEALDPINTNPAAIVPANIISRAWCEAVVQRFPDYVDPTNAPSVDPNSPTTSGTSNTATTITAMNQRFGRNFRIVAFRWLAPNDL